MRYGMSVIYGHPVIAATRALRFADHVTKRNGGSGDENVAFTAPNLCWACAIASPVTFLTGDILVPRAYDPSDLRQESRALGATISGMRHRRRLSHSRPQSLRFFWSRGRRNGGLW